MLCFWYKPVNVHPRMPKKPRSSPAETLPVPVELLERRIYLIRGHRVMLDRDLAELYQVKAIALRQQVKRNQQRFPADFMFQLTLPEANLLVSQNVIPSGAAWVVPSLMHFTRLGVVHVLE